MIEILLLILGQIATANIDIAFDNTTVIINETNSHQISHSTPADACNQIKIGKFCLYHLSSESTFQNWLLSEYQGTPNTLFYPQNSTNKILDFIVQTGDARLTLLNSGNNTLLKYVLLGASKSPNYSTKTVLSQPKKPSQLVQVLSNPFLYYQEYTYFDAFIKVTPKTVHNMETVGGKVSISPDKGKGAFYNNESIVYLYDFHNFSLLRTFYPDNSSLRATCTVTFDSSSSYMIIESDNVNPLQVVDINNYSIIFNASYPGIIFAASFIGVSTNFIVVIGDSGNCLIDTRTGLKYSISEMVISSIFAVDYANNNFYLCKDNTIYEYNFQVAALSPTNSTELPATIQESTFYQKFNMSSGQAAATQVINNGLENTVDVTKNIALFSANTPFTIYFLGFLNYFNLCSLYILLNFPIPQHVYNYLKLVYQSLNENFFSMLGVDLRMNPISRQLIDRDKPLFFGISSDVLSVNLEIFIVMAFNFLLLLIVQAIFWRVSNRHFLKKMYYKSRCGIIHGQVINVMISFILPWSFVIRNSDCSSLGNKVNFALYGFSMLTAFFFPFCHFFCLVVQQSQKLFKERLKKNQILTMQISKKISIKIEKEHIPFTLGELVTVNLLSEWMIGWANFFYPFLILLQNPIYFMIGVLVFTLSDFSMAAFNFKLAKNAFFLSIYPLIFHCCFLIFYFARDQKTLIYSQIVCLASLLIGASHFTITLLITSIYDVSLIIKQLCFKNKVSPQLNKKYAINNKSECCGSKKTKKRKVKINDQLPTVQAKRLSSSQNKIRKTFNAPPPSPALQQNKSLNHKQIKIKQQKTQRVKFRLEIS